MATQQTRRVGKHYPSMTARDFSLIADVLARIEADRPSKMVVAKGFADELAHTNDNFNRSRFIEACFYTEETN